MRRAVTQIEKIIKFQEMQRKKPSVLRPLLDETLRDEGHDFVEKARMGDSDSYLGVVSYRWIDKYIGLFTERHPGI